MDPVWKNLPLECSYMICNKLTQVRRISNHLKDDIETRIGHLNLYANSWSSWGDYRDRWEITREAIERWSQTRFFFEGSEQFSTEELCIMFWQSLTNEEKDDFINNMNRDSEFGDDIEREYAHWEQRNEMYLARMEDEAF